MHSPPADLNADSAAPPLNPPPSPPSSSPPSSSASAVAPASTNADPAWWQDIGRLLFLGGCCCLITLSRGLWDADESRYAEIPREMLVSNQWLIPTLNGFTYLEKPQLNYWPTVTLYHLFGVDPIWARLVPCLYFLGTLLLIYDFGRKMVSREVGHAAAGMLLFQPLFAFLGMHLLTDGPLTFWLTLAMVSLGRLRLAADPPKRWVIGFWVGCLGAFFIKSLIGLAFPIGMLILDLLLRGRWRSFARVAGVMLLGGLVTLALCAGWLVAMERAVPGFYLYFFITQHLDRFTGSQHAGNWYFFLFAWLVFTWPWWPLVWPAVKTAAQALWQSRRPQPVPAADSAAPATLPAAPAGASVGATAVPHADLRALLLIFAGTIYLFFSISRGQLITYFLPAIPPLMLLLSVEFHLAPPIRQKQCVLTGWLTGWAVVFGAVVLLLRQSSQPSLELEMDTGPMRVLAVGTVMMLATAVFYLLFGYRFLPRKPGRDPLIPYMLLMLVLLYGFRYISPNQSGSQVATSEIVRRLAATHPDYLAVHWSRNVNESDQASGLYFGLRRPVYHVGRAVVPEEGSKRNELLYCLPHTDPAYSREMLYPDWAAFVAAQTPGASEPPRHVLLFVPRNREIELPLDLAPVEPPLILGRYILYHLTLAAPAYSPIPTPAQVQ